MLTYKDQARRVAIAVAAMLLTAIAAYLLLLPREAPTEEYVSGVVVTPDGTPIHGATVYVLHNPYEDPRDLMPSSLRARSGAEGAFSLGGLQFWDYYLVATHPDFCDSEGVAVRVTPQGLRDVRVQLLEGGRIEGSVNPSHGEVSGRKIQLYSRAGSRGWRSAETDKGGRFAIDKVIPGEYTIELRTPDNDNSNLRMSIKVTRGRTTTLVLGKD